VSRQRCIWSSLDLGLGEAELKKGYKDWSYLPSFDLLRFGENLSFLLSVVSLSGN
jgi:hypothetical protein